MTSETTAKKDIQKLQRAIVDGLEDVKAQDIAVFNTEQLSPLFERVIVASGTSNRQTKALAASVVDAVREAGFDKPRVEGEDNGEWIIVDCGPAVVHVMQPVIRQYYRLEDIWGTTKVRMKLGAAKVAAAKAAAADATAPKKPRRTATRADDAAPVPAKAVVRAVKKSAARSAEPAVKPAVRKTAKPRTASGTSTAVQRVVVVKPRATTAAPRAARPKKA
ncbi:MAG: ribosome silencing factor [Pseudomonadota bacterium]|jgi:ribosome-associated protein